MNTARQAVDSFDMLSRAVPGGFLDLSLEAERPGSRDQTSLFRGWRSCSEVEPGSRKPGSPC